MAYVGNYQIVIIGINQYSHIENILFCQSISKDTVNLSGIVKDINILVIIGKKVILSQDICGWKGISKILNTLIFNVLNKGIAK